MTELKRAVCSWRMVLAVYLALLILMGPLYTDTLFRHNMWSYMAGYDILDLITGPMALAGFSPFACIFPMIFVSHFRDREEFVTFPVKF